MSSLQKIENGELRNLSVLGKHLVNCLETEEALDLADDFYEGSWLNGRCWELAMALKMWVGDQAELVCVGPEINGRVSSHVIVKVSIENDDPVYLDGDGVGTEDDILTKMKKLECIEDPVFGAYDYEYLLERGVIRDTLNPNNVYEYLKMNLPEFNCNDCALNEKISSSHSMGLG